MLEQSQQTVTRKREGTMMIREMWNYTAVSGFRNLFAHFLVFICRRCENLLFLCRSHCMSPSHTSGTTVDPRGENHRYCIDFFMLRRI
jgi:hypothetical protein